MSKDSLYTLLFIMFVMSLAVFLYTSEVTWLVFTVLYQTLILELRIKELKSE